MVFKIRLRAKEFFSNYKFLILIFILAFFLRAAGSTHAFPFITHPDEPSVIRSATGIRFDANPGHFDWPHFYFYLNYILYFVFIKFRGLLQILGLRSALEAIFPILWQDPLVFYFLSRIFNSLLGALTVVPVFLAAKELYTKKAGYYAALALAITPFHIWHAHYALIDVPMVFWLAWALYFSTLILKSSDTKNYLLAGLFVGFAASTKYNGGLIALSVVLAHFLRVYKASSESLFNVVGIKRMFFSRDLVLAGFMAVLGFVIGTPYSILDYTTFIRTDGPQGALWQFTNVGKVGLDVQIQQFFTNLATKLSKDLGYSFLYAYLLLGIISFVKRKSIDFYKAVFIFAPSLFFFWYISGFSKTRSHYYMITYPFVAVAAGYLFSQIAGFVKSKSIEIILLILLFLIPSYFAAKQVYTLIQPDTRNILYSWMSKNVKDPDLIVYDDNDFDPVLEKFSKNRVRRGLNEKYLVNESGVIIVESPLVLENFTQITSTFVKSITAGLKSGPDILIYTFNNE